MKPLTRIVPALGLLTALVVVGHGEAHAQGVRGSATTTARYIELRPIIQDTVSVDQVTQLPDGSFVYNGIPATCITGLGCMYYRAGEVAHAAFGTQDVGLTTWGWGMQGLSFTTLLRLRTDLGGELTWPGSDDNFDAILAYGELNRGDFRTRLGRQRVTSTLGLTGYDGLNVVWDGVDALTVEGYGGRSLMRGLNEPRAEALRPVQEFAMDTLVTWLVGAAARYEPFRGTHIGLRYQYEIFQNRAGLVSERAALEFGTSQFRPIIFDGAVDYDFAFGHIGRAHATVRAPVFRGITLEATGRRYLPYFELNTIWGFFSPVGYHEVEGRATWRAAPTLTTWASAAWRRYQEADATVIFRPIEQEGTRGNVGATWRMSDGLVMDAAYRIEHGFGAFVSSGDASVAWRPTQRIELSVDGTAFQQIEQFRVGEGIVFGGGMSTNIALTDRMELSGGATMYRQNFRNRPGMPDWNQMRGWTALRVGFGNDPGMRRMGGAR